MNIESGKIMGPGLFSPFGPFLAMTANCWPLCSGPLGNAALDPSPIPTFLHRVTRSDVNPGHEWKVFTWEACFFYTCPSTSRYFGIGGVMRNLPGTPRGGGCSLLFLNLIKAALQI